MSLNPRKISVQIIYGILKKDSTLSQTLAIVRREKDFDTTDKRFISELVTGTVRHMEYLDYAISCASDIKTHKIAPYVMCVLRTGAYQILFMDKIPESAAVNESVKIIKKSSNHRLSGFVNAVLRKIASNGRNINLPEDEFKSNCIKYSCPEWIAKLWKDSLGDDYADLLIKLVVRAGIEKGIKLSKDQVNRINDLFEEDLLYKVEAIDWDDVDTSNFEKD